MLENYIARLVAFILIPVLTPTAAIVAAWAQDAVGLDLTGAQLTGFVVSTAAGVAIAGATWLKNRGEWEKAVHLATSLHDRGDEELGER